MEYLRHGDQSLLARVFKPIGSGPFPVMVELHGGAWVRGDRLNGNPAPALVQMTRCWQGMASLSWPWTFARPAQVQMARARLPRHPRENGAPPLLPTSTMVPLLPRLVGVTGCRSEAKAWNGRPDAVGVMGTSSPSSVQVRPRHLYKRPRHLYKSGAGYEAP